MAKKITVMVAHAGETNPEYFLSVGRIEDKCDEYYRLIGCEYITIIQRKINGKVYELVCDDEALLKSGQSPCAVNSLFDEVIYGNIVIAGEADAKGNLTALTPDDISSIFNSTRSAFIRHANGDVTVEQILEISL